MKSKRNTELETSALNWAILQWLRKSVSGIEKDYRQFFERNDFVSRNWRKWPIATLQLYTAKLRKKYPWAAVEFFPIEITRKYRWKLAVFAIIVNYLSYLDIAQYRTTDDLMTHWFLIISLYYEEIFLFGLITMFTKFSVNCHVSAS